MSAAADRNEFARLVRQILVVEKRRAVRDVATALRMTYGTFYGRMSGRVPFRPEELNELLRVLPDRRLADCLLAHTDFIAVPRVGASDPSSDTRNTNAAIHAAEESLAALKGINEAIANGRDDEAQRHTIEMHIHEAQRALGSLQITLPDLLTPSDPRNDPPKRRPREHQEPHAIPLNPYDDLLSNS